MIDTIIFCGLIAWVVIMFLFIQKNMNKTYEQSILARSESTKLESDALTKAYMNGRKDLIEFQKKRQVEVPFKLDKYHYVMFEQFDIHGNAIKCHPLYPKLKDMGIDQKQIKRILLEIKDGE